MAKVYFYYGTMNSSKTLNLLATAHNFESQGKKILCFKPEKDDRDIDIRTRAGLSRMADVVLGKDDNDIVKHVRDNGYIDLHAILVDEAQFLTKEQILGFVEVADIIGIPVFFYGLKTDFKGELFEGSKALIELASELVEVKMECSYCDSKATMNVRLDKDGNGVFEGEQILTGDTKVTEAVEYYYKPVCRKCFMQSKNGKILGRK